MKKMTAGILAVALSSTLFAGNTDNYSVARTFIGAEVGYMAADGSIAFYDDFYGVKRKFDLDGDNDMEYGFHLGAEDGNWRTTFMYNYFKNDEGSQKETTHKGGLYLDYFIWSSETNDMAIKPYIGGHVGYMSYKLTGDIGLGSDEVLADDSNMYYGGQIGIALTASEVLQIDLSYRYSWTNLHDMSGTIANIDDLDVDLDSMDGFVVGLNYFF